MSIHSILRILDANFNRAREALRVMEEYARFVLDDASLTEAMKCARHELVEAVRGIGETKPRSDEATEGRRGEDTEARSDEATEGPRDNQKPQLLSSGTSIPLPGPAPRDEVRLREQGSLIGRLNPAGLHPLGSRSLLGRVLGCGSESEGMSARTEVRGSLVCNRDIVGDVGREVTTAWEFRRAGAWDVAMAAAKRLSEALRVIEEYGKTIDADSAAAIEGLRYRGYELERRLFVVARAKERFGGVRLYVLLTESHCRGEWFATAEAALRGGADCIQLREKDLTDRELLDRARRLVALCREHGAMLIVNDRPDIAAAAGADGVHVGQEDLPVAAVRRMVPAECIVGVSTHTVEQADAMIAEGPDYVAVGPMFESATKPQGHIAGLETLRAVRARTSLPLVAIGGIDSANARAVAEAGAECVCVCRSIIGDADPVGAATRIREEVEAGRAALAGKLTEASGEVRAP